MRGSLRRFCLIASALLPLSAWAGTAVPFTINLSKPVNVATSGGTPRIAVDVAGTTRYANYTSGSGTSALVFTYQMQAGDVDLDGVAVSSPVQLNGGTIKDLSGNPLTNLTFTPPNTAGVKVNYPSLGMDFTNGAGGRYTLNGTPYTTLASFLTAAGGSFTRASVGTYFDSAGVLQTAASGAARFDYDPVTHAAKGILIEEARTNLAQRSAEFDNAYWTQGSIGIATNATTSPDGTSNAEKLVPNGAATVHTAYRLGGVAGGTTYTLSVYAKAGGYNWLKLQSTSFYANFNLSSGVKGNLNSTTSSILPIGGGWYRCSMTFTTSGAGNFETKVGSADIASVTDVFSGDGTSGIYIWGAQLELGAFPTSYIPTTTAAVTRQRDLLTVPTGGWFNAPQGTAFAQADLTGNSAVGGVFSLTEDSANRVDLRAGAAQAIISSGGVSTTLAPITFPLGNSNKVSIAYSSSIAAAAINGGSILTGTPRVPLSINKLRIGSIDAGAQPLNGHVSKFKYYPVAISNTQLQLMTQ